MHKGDCAMLCTLRACVSYQCATQFAALLIWLCNSKATVGRAWYNAAVMLSAAVMLLAAGCLAKVQRPREALDSSQMAAVVNRKQTNISVAMI